MKLSEQILRKPLYVAFGQALPGGGITSVDLVTTRDAGTVTMTASDGSAAPIAGADASTAGVMTAVDKTKLDGLSNATTKDFATGLAVATSVIAAGVSHIRTAGHSIADDGGQALYARVGVEPTHNLKAQSVDGAWWELIPDASGVNVRQAGAVGNGVADDTQAIRDCIDFLGVGNGRIFLPRGTYHVTAPIIVEHNVAFEGEGYGTLTIGRSTIISVAAGVTGFMVRRGGFGADDGYGDNALFRNLEILAEGKNATTTTGTMSAASKTLTLAAAADFADGDLIMVRGAGEAHTLMSDKYLTAATTAASPTVTLSQLAGVYPGMVISVAGAGFPADAVVVSRVNQVVTMSANAVSTVAAGAVTYRNDLAVQIMSGGGTTVLTVNEAADVAVAGAVVLHYDCAIYAQSRLSVDRVAARNFQGAGVFIHAGSDVDSVSTRATNANNWRVNDVILTGGRNGLRLKGNDANAGTVLALDAGANVEYGLVDASFLGNYFFGVHVSGGYGYMTVFLNAQSTFTACYTEGGTHNTFAEKTLVLGGLMGGGSADFAGGGSLIQGANVLYSSPLKMHPDWWAGVKLLIGNRSNTAEVMQIDASAKGGSAGTVFKRTSLAAGGQDGLWGWMPDGSTTKVGMLFSDTDAEAGAGHAYFPRGVFMGRNNASLALTNFRRQVGGTAAPTTLARVRGDIVWNHSPVAAGWAGWICVTSGTPGVWKGFGAIEA